MRIKRTTAVIAIGLLAITAQAPAQETDAALSPEKIAGECQVSIAETPHLKLLNGLQHAEDEPFCGMHFKNNEHVAVGGIAVLFYPRQLEKDDNYGIGFSRSGESQDKWRFDGTSDLLLDSRIIKRSFTQQHDGPETLLVGHQLLRGKMPNGGVTELPGVRILRLTPMFVISVEMNFEPMTAELSMKAYQQRLDVITSELVDVVKSVRPTPGVSGPTIRKL